MTNNFIERYQTVTPFFPDLDSNWESLCLPVIKTTVICHVYIKCTGDLPTLKTSKLYSITQKALFY